MYQKRQHTHSHTRETVVSFSEHYHNTFITTLRTLNARTQDTRNGL